MEKISWREITNKSDFLNRRQFIKRAGKLIGFTGVALAAGPFALKVYADEHEPALSAAAKSPFSTDEPTNSVLEATNYNNFYEFGLSKESPARNARSFQSRPWEVSISGEVNKPMTLDIDQLIRLFTIEERIYRFRCVEAWSMVIPWLGFPLADLIKQVEVTSAAKYVEFETLFDPGRMPGQRSNVIQWPYVEGLRLDEAVNPLSLLAVGMYGETLPNQNGAPLRLVVPWKYGFKSIKSIVAIRFVREQPGTSWSTLAPHEYGFFANVNPDVNHPRWSQRTERRIGKRGRVPTALFNGYGEYVAGMYTGMNLAKNY